MSAICLKNIILPLLSDNQIENFLICTAKTDFDFILFYHNVRWDVIQRVNLEFNSHEKIINK